MEKFIDHCCEKCFNSEEKRCDVFVECCLEGPICHESKPCKKTREAIVDKYSHSSAFRDH